MTKERELQDSLYQEFAKIGKSISSPKRVEILDLLSQGPKSVEELAEATTMSVANVSQHLRTLYNLRMVTSHKQGNYVIYEIKNEEITDFLTTLHSLSEKQFIEVQQIKQEFLNDNLGLNGVSLKELDEWMNEKNILLLDVRPKTEYENNHIDGAISVPIEKLKEEISSFPTDQEIVVYCRGTYCLLSVEAVGLLKEYGVEASRFQYSVQEWQEYQDQLVK